MKSPPRLRRRLGIAAGLVVLYTVTGFWILPPIVKSQLEQRLAETIAVDDNDLRTLAQERARRVRDYFTTTGGIEADRVLLAKDRAETAGPGKGPRVFLCLQ